MSGPDSGWCFIEDHGPDGVVWLVSIDGGFNPWPWRALRCRTATVAKAWLARLFMGNNGKVGEA